MAQALADGPFGPWRFDAEPGVAKTRKGPDLPYPSHRAFYSLWYQLAKVGITAQAAGKMEVWQAAAALGVGYEAEADEAVARSDPRARGAARRTSSRDLLRQRVAASQGLAPPPQPSATNTAEVNEMMAAMSMPSR